ncbi:MAG: protein kinase [Planctomycetota bacterium]
MTEPDPQPRPRKPVRRVTGRMPSVPPPQAPRSEAAAEADALPIPDHDFAADFGSAPTELAFQAPPPQQAPTAPTMPAHRPPLERTRMDTTAGGGDSGRMRTATRTQISERSTGVGIGPGSGTGRAENALVVLRSGKFRIQAPPLGEGGAGIVKPARDLSLRRDLAVKTMRHPEDAHARLRFIDEAQITGQLQHPNIVPVYELALDEAGAPFIAMKRVAGKNLRDVIRELHAESVGLRPDPARSAREERQLLEIFLKICDGMAYAHSRKILHRDLKPQNIMVGEFGEVLVMDWGLARPFGSVEAQMAFAKKAVTSDRRLAEMELTTDDGVVVGTIPYMPPEQAEGRMTELDMTADVYSLGAILYTMLTGVPPFAGNNPEDVRRQVVEGRLVPPSQRAPHRRIPAELEAVVLTAMHRSRRHRYATVIELRTDIEHYMEGRALEAVDYTRWQLLMKWAGRHRTAVLGAAATFLAVVAGLVGFVFMQQAQQAERQRAAEAELKSEREEAGRKQAEQAARDAKLRELVANGEMNALRETLGLRLQFERDSLADGFIDKLVTIRETGGSHQEMLRRIGRENLERYASVFERNITASDELKVTTRADDYACLGLIRHIQGDAAGALPLYSRAIELEPDQARYFEWRSDAKFDSGDTNGALADCDRAVTTEPSRARVWLTRGMLRTKLQMLPGAENDFRQAIELDPDDPDPLGWLGQVRRMRGDSQECLELAEKALRMRPDHGLGLLARACARGDLGDQAGCMRDLDRIIQLDDQNLVAWNNRALCRYRANNRAGAISDMDAVIRLDPTNANAYATRAQWRAESGLQTDALADCDAALKLQPDKVEALALRAVLRYQTRDLRGAMVDVDRGLQLMPGNLDLITNRGAIYMAMGEYSRAVSDFDQVLSAQPDWSDVRSYRARARAGNGDNTGALADANTAMQQNPNDMLARVIIGIVLVRDNQFANGAGLLQQGMPGNPDVWEGWEAMGIAAAKLDQRPSAEVAFKRALDGVPASHRDALLESRRRALGN